MKKLLLILIFSIFSISLYAQDTAVPSETEDEDTVLQETESFETDDYKGQKFTKSESFSDFIHSMDFVIQTETGVYLNTGNLPCQFWSFVAELHFYFNTTRGKFFYDESPLV